MLEVPDVDLIWPSGVVFCMFIGAWTCGVMSVRLVVCSLSVFLSMCLFVLCVLCLNVIVNCLLQCGDVVSLGKYVFITIMSLVLPLCICNQL